MSMQDPALEAFLAQRRNFFGKYAGLVVDNRDSLKRGRLQVQVAAVLGNVSVWALPCVPYAGKGVGLYALPKPGTAVWVEFEAGDSSFPIWTGCLWSKGDIADADADPSIKFFKTEKFTLRIDDAQGEIRIESRNGGTDPASQITLGAIEIKLKSAAVKVEGAGGKTLDLDAVSLRVHKSALEVI